MRRLVAVSLVASLLGSCIHTDERIDHDVGLADQQQHTLQRIKNGDLEFDHLIYTPSKLPLEDFFSRMMNGEFAEALKRIDLRYKPAESDNAAIQTLLDAGIVPVYVRVTNSGSKPMKFDPESLQLADDTDRFAAIAAKNLPRTFKQLNPKAVGANVANTVIVFAAAVGVMVVIAAVVVASSKGGVGGHVGNFGDIPGGSSSGSDSSIYNSVHQTVAISYQNLLLPAVELAPGATTKGLVFFRVPTKIDRSDLRLF